MNVWKGKYARGPFLAAVAASGLLLLAVGCGPQVKKAAQVDVDIARQSLEAVLADWKGGGSPEAWQKRSPQVVVQDFDWTSGAKLKTYEILGPGEARDANLFCKVRLTVEKDSRPEEDLVVTYCVGTDPVVTVFREVGLQ
jgi:hypothetical protein